MGSHRSFFQIFISLRLFAPAGSHPAGISGRPANDCHYFEDRSRPVKDPRRDSWLFIGTGLLSLVFFNYCYFRAIDGSSISIAVLLLYTALVFVMLLSLILFGEKFTGRKMLALLATFCGCGLITGIFASKLALTAEAFAFGLASGFGYALYSILANWPCGVTAR